MKSIVDLTCYSWISPRLLSEQRETDSPLSSKSDKDHSNINACYADDDACRVPDHVRPLVINMLRVVLAVGRVGGAVWQTSRAPMNNAHRGLSMIVTVVGEGEREGEFTKSPEKMGNRYSWLEIELQTQHPAVL